MGEETGKEGERDIKERIFYGREAVVKCSGMIQGEKEESMYMRFKSMWQTKVTRSEVT